MASIPPRRTQEADTPVRRIVGCGEQALVPQEGITVLHASPWAVRSTAVGDAQ